MQQIGIARVAAERAQDWECFDLEGQRTTTVLEVFFEPGERLVLISEARIDPSKIGPS